MSKNFLTVYSYENSSTAAGHKWINVKQISMKYVFESVSCELQMYMYLQ